MRLIFLVLLALPFQVIAQTYLLHCGTLVDVISKKTDKEMTVSVENGIITNIQKGYINATNAEDSVINLRNCTVMPGLMDMHVHMEWETSSDSYLRTFTESDVEAAFNSIPFAKTTLMAGFTTVRDLGGSGVNIALRDAINANVIPGPRMFTAGKSIATTGGHADPTNGFRRELMSDAGPKEGVADGLAQCAEAVRWRYKEGADCIKITGTGGVLSVAKSGDAPQFSEEEMKQIVETADDYNMIVAVHAHGAEGMKRAVNAGVATIEHGSKMTDEVMDLMIKNQCYLVPTIAAGKTVEEKAKLIGYYPEVVRKKALEIGPMIQNTFAKAWKKGVPIVFGTDAGVFSHGDNWKEFVYMTEVGMPMMEAITTATIIPAKILGIDKELGSIEVGKTADIIAVDGDPLADPSLMQTMKMVMKEGKIYRLK